MKQRSLRFLSFNQPVRPQQGVDFNDLWLLVNDVTDLNNEIDALSRLINSLSTTGVTFAGDLSGTSTSQTVIGLQTIPIAAAAPTLNDVLTYDGAQWVGTPSASGFITSIDNTGNDVTLTAPGGVLSANLTSLLISQFTNDAGYITSVTPQALTQNQIAFGDASNLVTSSADLTWVQASKDFNVTGTISLVVNNTANAAYIAQGNIGYWLTGAASTGLLAHQGFGIDMKTTEKYTMGAVGLGNNNYLEINDSASTATLSTLAGVGTRMVTASATGVLGTAAIPTIASLSPLTTKGDLFTYSTVNDRLAIGVRNGNVLQVASGAATGNAWSSSTYPSTAGASGKIIISDGTDNVYSTPTYPNTAGAGKVLIGDGTNIVLSTPTFPNVSGSALNWLRSDGTNWIASTGKLAESAVTAGKILRSNATDWLATTATYPDTVTASRLLYASAANVISDLATANSAVLVTDGSGVPSIGTTLPNINIGTPTAGVLTNCTGTVYALTGGTLTTGGTQLADATTYFFGSRIEATQTRTATGATAIYFPIAGTIISARVIFTQNASSGESSTLALRLNNTTDITLSSGVLNNATLTTVIATGLTQAVNATTDYVEFKMTTATWVTNPTGVCVFWEILVRT